MKISKYTFFFDIENTDFYAYNTLSNALIEIDQESYNILHNRIQDEDLSEMLFDNDLWNALVTNNILIVMYASKMAYCLLMRIDLNLF